MEHVIECVAIMTCMYEYPAIITVAIVRLERSGAYFDEIRSKLSTNDYGKLCFSSLLTILLSVNNTIYLERTLCITELDIMHSFLLTKSIRSNRLMTNDEINIFQLLVIACDKYSYKSKKLVTKVVTKATTLLTTLSKLLSQLLK